MADDDKRSIVDIAVELECDIVRPSWGRVLLTSDRTLALDALDKLIAAHKAISKLLESEGVDRGTT